LEPDPNIGPKNLFFILPLKKIIQKQKQNINLNYIKKNSNFLKACFDKEIHPKLKWKFFYHYSIFIQYSNCPINLFLFNYMKKIK
jgi:hypothetical protein